MTRSTLTGALTAVLGLVVLPAVQATASPPQPALSPVATGSSCSLVDSTFTATASVDEELQGQFWSYGDTGEGWTGADSTYSVPLMRGGEVWIFSDTFLGPVNPDGSRPQSTPFLNNSLIVRDADGSMRTITGGTAEEPDGIVPMSEDGSWHWFGDGELRPNGDLQIGVLEFSRFGDGYWDWGWSGNEVVTIDTKTWSVTSLDPIPSSANIQWASWYQREGGHTYVYGVEDLGAVKYMHAARVLGGDLTKQQNWRFWDGSNWVKEESASVRVMPNVANEYSVTPYRDGYLLVTQDTSEVFSPHIEAYVSCSPQGPFTHATRLYSTPETGPFGTYGSPDVWTYNAHEHPELREGDRLTITYNVNSFDTDDVYEDVTIYRPRFVEVQLDVTPAGSSTTRNGSR